VYTGRSAARLARLLREQEVPGSNPGAPTSIQSPVDPRGRRGFASQVCRGWPDTPGMDVREARLKEEYAGEYPGLAPGVWMRVSDIARTLVERARARRREGRFTRTFDPTHFEFRGGSKTPRSPAVRSRSTDRRPRRPDLPDSPHRPSLEA
jgi:hypothetical protein